MRRLMEPLLGLPEASTDGRLDASLSILWKPSAMLLKLRRSNGLLYCFSANSLLQTDMEQIILSQRICFIIFTCQS
jgi:hypothetical protein